MMQIIRKIKKAVYNRYRFIRDIKCYNQLNLDKTDFPIKFNKLYRIYSDCEDAGTVDGHYFLQDLFMAKEIIKCNPRQHYDIGSRIDGFIAHLLASNINVTLVDIRPFPVQLEGLSFIQTDATELSNIEDNSLNSLSSLHVIEHFGLGRYGDTIDPEAWKSALLSMQNKIAPGGCLFLSVPVSKNNVVCYNAHRIFNPITIINTLNKMKLIRFLYIQDYQLHEVDVTNIENSIGLLHECDCGLFILKK